MGRAGQSRHSGGESDYASLTATVGPLPMAPSGVSTARSGPGEVNVSWTAAPSTTQQPVAGYRVRWAESPSGANPLTFDVASTATSLKIPNLNAGQQYSFDVASYNDLGPTYTGSPAAATPCTVTPPTSASVTEVTGTGLSISWVLPTGLTCAISSIEAAYVAKGATITTPVTGWTSVTVSGTTATSVTASVSDADLAANDYAVRVRTTNSAGFTSQWTLNTIATPLPSDFRWFDDTPTPNYTLKRVFLRVGLPSGDDGSVSATCAMSGAASADGNCPPNTLVNRQFPSDLSTLWDQDISVTFTATDPFSGATYTSEASTGEIGGPGAKSNFTLVAGDGTISVTWPATSAKRSGASMVGYKVEYRRDLETDYTVVTLDDADARTYTITDLLNGATYYVRVRGFSDTGVAGDDCSPDDNGVWPDAKCHDGFSTSPKTARPSAS